MANCHDRSSRWRNCMCIIKDQFRKKRRHKIQLPVPLLQESFAATTSTSLQYVRSAGRSILLSASDPTLRYIEQKRLIHGGGGKYTGYEFFFRYFLGTKYQVLDALRKSTSAGPQCLFLRTHAGIFDVSTCAGAWLFTALYV